MKKQSKIIFNKNGKGNISIKICLPFSWIKEMGISENNKNVNLFFENKEIIIRKG